MKKSLFTWDNVLTSLGYRVNWSQVWANVARKSRTRKREQQSGLQFASLEHRKLLAGVVAEFDHVHVNVMENETFQATVVFDDLSGDQAYTFVTNRGDGSSATTSSPSHFESQTDDEVATRLEEEFVFAYESSGEYQISVDAVAENGDVVDTRIIDVIVEDSVAEIVSLLGLGHDFEGESFTFSRGEFERTEVLEGQQNPFSITFLDDDTTDNFTATLELNDGSAPISLVQTDVVDGDLGRQVTFESPSEIAFADDGLYAAVITLVDDEGSENTYRIDVEVSDVAPTINTIVSSSSVGVGESFAIQATATDPGQDHVGQWLIDWGDGSTEIHTGSLATAQHQWAYSGYFNIGIQAINEDVTTEATIVQVAVTNAFGGVDTAASAALQFTAPSSVLTQTSALWRQDLGSELIALDPAELGFRVFINGQLSTEAEVVRDEAFEDNPRHVLVWATPAQQQVVEVEVEAFNSDSGIVYAASQITVGLVSDVAELSSQLESYVARLNESATSISEGASGGGAPFIFGAGGSGFPFLDRSSDDGGSDDGNNSGGDGSSGGGGSSSGGTDEGVIGGGFSGGSGAGSDASSNPYADSGSVNGSYTVDAGSLGNSAPVAGSSTPNFSTPTAATDAGTGNAIPDVDTSADSFSGPDSNPFSSQGTPESPNQEVSAPFADAFTPTSPTSAVSQANSYSGSDVENNPLENGGAGIGSNGGDDGSVTDDGGDSGSGAGGGGASGEQDSSGFYIPGVELLVDSVERSAQGAPVGRWDAYQSGDIETGDFFAVDSQSLGDNLNLLFVERTSIDRSVQNAVFAEVTQRSLFYNNSAFDTVSDENAIASDRIALLEGQRASANNFSSYDKGINGLFVEFSADAGNVTSGDFVFRTGNSTNPDAWATVSPDQVSIETNEFGEKRAKITFADGQITNQWLQVRVLANANTNLQQDDIFYFGSSVGDTAGVTTSVLVDQNDIREIEANFTASGDATFADRSASTVNDKYDINRDGVVDAADRSIVQANLSNIADGFVPMLNLIQQSSSRGTWHGSTGGQRETFSVTVTYEILFGTNAELAQLESTGSFAGIEHRVLSSASAENSIYIQSNAVSGLTTIGGSYAVGTSTDYATHGTATAEDAATYEGIREGEGYFNRIGQTTGIAGSSIESFRRDSGGNVIQRTFGSSSTNQQSYSRSDGGSWQRDDGEDDNEHSDWTSSFESSSSESRSSAWNVSIDPATGEQVVEHSWIRLSSYEFASSEAAAEGLVNPIFTTGDTGIGGDDGQGGDDDGDSGDGGTDDQPPNTMETTGSSSSSGSVSSSSSGSGSANVSFHSRLTPSSYVSNLDFDGQDNGNGTAAESGNATTNYTTTSDWDDQTLVVNSTANSGTSGNGSSAGDRSSSGSLSASGASSSDYTTSGDVNQNSSLAQLSGDGTVNVNSSSTANLSFDGGSVVSTVGFGGDASGDSKLDGPAGSRRQFQLDDGAATGNRKDNGGLQSSSDGNSTVSSSVDADYERTWTDDDGNLITIEYRNDASSNTSIDGKETSSSNGSETATAGLSNAGGQRHEVESVTVEAGGSASSAIPRANSKEVGEAAEYSRLKIVYADGRVYELERTVTDNGKSDTGGGATSSGSGATGGNLESQSTSSNSESESGTRTTGDGTTTVSEMETLTHSRVVAGVADIGLGLEAEFLNTVPLFGALPPGNYANSKLEYSKTTNETFSYDSNGSFNEDGKSEIHSGVRTGSAAPAGPATEQLANGDAYESQSSEGEFRSFLSDIELNSNSSFNLGSDTPNATTTWTRKTTLDGGDGTQILLDKYSESTESTTSNFKFTDESKVEYSTGSDGLTITQGGYTETTYTVDAKSTNPEDIISSNSITSSYGSGSYSEKIAANNNQASWYNRTTVRTDYNDVGLTFAFDSEYGISITPTGSQTVKTSETGNEIRKRHIEYNFDSSWDVRDSNGVVRQRNIQSGQRKNELDLKSDWNLTTTVTETPGSAGGEVELEQGGHRAKKGKLRTSGNHDLLRLRWHSNGDYERSHKSGNYTSVALFNHRLERSGGATRTFSEGSDPVTENDTRGEPTLTGSGGSIATSTQRADWRLEKTNGDVREGSSLRRVSQSERFEIGKGAWGERDIFGSGENSESSYSFEDHPDAKTFLDQYGTIGYQVFTIDLPVDALERHRAGFAQGDLLDKSASFSAGLGDGLSFGLSYLGRLGVGYLAGTGDLTDYKSGAYSAGGWAAAGVDFVSGGGIAAVKGVVKGAGKRVSALGARYIATNFGDDAAAGTARAASGIASKITRDLRLPKTHPDLAGTTTLGITTPNGSVFLQPGLSRATQAHVLRHEGVHAFLSVADDAPLAGLRQSAGIGAYKNSAFFTAAEEILAEGIASGSLRQGWRHAFNGAYRVRKGTRFETVVNRQAFFTELGVGATGLGILGYGAYQLGDYVFGGEE